MQKIKIKHATITDKIYIKESDIEDVNSFKSAYTYLIVDDILFTYELDKEKNICEYAKNIVQGINKQEVVSIPKELEKKGFFEKLFHFFK